MALTSYGDVDVWIDFEASYLSNGLAKKWDSKSLVVEEICTPF
jgi:hypothetical protein